MGDVKTAADGTVVDMEVIANIKTIMIVRGVTIYATRARTNADASDREQGGNG